MEKRLKKALLPFECPVAGCGKAYGSQKALNKHKSEKHTKSEREKAKQNIKTFKCEDCARGHPSKDSLRKHRKICTANGHIQDYEHNYPP